MARPMLSAEPTPWTRGTPSSLRQPPSSQRQSRISAAPSAARGILNVGLKSGTNSIHGTAYAFGRTDALDARNPFLPPAAPKQPTAIEDFGSTIGGPRHPQRRIEVRHE